MCNRPVAAVSLGGERIRQVDRRANSPRRRGLTIYAETCPQYLVLTAEGLNMDISGAKYVCSPPPRDSASQAAIWQALRAGVPDLFVGPLPISLPG